MIKYPHLYLEMIRVGQKNLYEKNTYEARGRVQHSPPCDFCYTHFLLLRYVQSDTLTESHTYRAKTIFFFFNFFQRAYQVVGVCFLSSCNFFGYTCHLIKFNKVKSSISKFILNSNKLIILRKYNTNYSIRSCDIKILF